GETLRERVSRLLPATLERSIGDVSGLGDDLTKLGSGALDQVVGIGPRSFPFGTTRSELGPTLCGRICVRSRRALYPPIPSAGKIAARPPCEPDLRTPRDAG